MRRAPAFAVLALLLACGAAHKPSAREIVDLAARTARDYDRAYTDWFETSAAQATALPPLEREAEVRRLTRIETRYERVHVALFEAIIAAREAVRIGEQPPASLHDALRDMIALVAALATGGEP